MASPPDGCTDKVSDGKASEDAAYEDVQLRSTTGSSLEQADLHASDISFSQLLSFPMAEAISPKQLSAIAPISLAYIGDAVFELYVRSRLLIPSKRIRDYHQQVVGQVKAEQQSCHVDTLLPHLNEAEKDIVRRGRNATTGRNRRAKGQDYQKATGLEALIGFLYLSDPARLINLLDQLEIL